MSSFVPRILFLTICQALFKAGKLDSINRPIGPPTNSADSTKFSNPDKRIAALENRNLFQGDISTDFAEPLLFYQAIANRSLQWPNGVVYYQFSRNHFTDEERSQIRMAMLTIESSTCVRFRRAKGRPDYVRIFKGDGCFSSVGKVGGQQLLSLGHGCLYLGTALHELMHAIGFYHTHMRADRDLYLKIDLDNVQPSFWPQFDLLYAWEERSLVPFDYDSIMMYGEMAFSQNGRRTMRPRQTGVRLTYPFEKNGLSHWDVVAINRLYGCSS